MTWFLVAHQALYLVDIPGGYNPNASGIPGAGTLMDVTNWTAFLVLGLCVLGLVASAVSLLVGIGYGLSAALHGGITFKDGAVVESNFNDYAPLRMNEMPSIEVHIVPSSEKPTGVGEPGTPVIAPAVANAIFAATGERLRKLPLRPATTAA